MPVSQLANDFLTALRRSRLLSWDDLQDAAVTLRQLHEPSRADIARVLVEEGYLTRYQAERLLEGNFRGLVVDNYKILEILGAGGMGFVYIAEDLETRWRVALKVLPEACRREAGTLARFQLEAQAGMRLKHPNIVRTYSLKQDEDIYGPIHYVVMELVRGVNLYELLVIKKQLGIGQACDIILQAAEGLAYAHQQGLVHRDIKPENLLVSADGTVKILDFGLAMVDENDEEFSMAMIFGQDRLGTADYISPEQYLDSYSIDERADIYSLGCSLYFALTGRVPFPYKSSAQKLKAHLKKKPLPVRRSRPEIPKRLAAVVAKMMAKHPDNRLQRCAEVARFLKPYAERKEISIDFRAVLNARAVQARKRLAGDKSGKKEASTHELQIIPSARSSRLQSDTQPRQSTIETIVREETRLNQSSPRPGEDDPPVTNKDGLKDDT